jgi:2-octaprenyl-6-methoxyphenol hydroxylase
MNDSREQEFDLVVVGGGLVGASLAAALRHSGMRIAVVERWPFSDDSQPSYDERTVALTWSTRNIFHGMGVWDTMSLGAEAIVDIHVSDRGGAGAAHLNCHHAGTPALGYVVPTRVVGGALLGALSDADTVRLICPAEAVALERDTGRRRLVVNTDGGSHALTAPLVVIADGGRSGLAGDSGLAVTAYDQQALLSIVTTDRPHRGRAWERFTREGPLALLPLGDNRLAVVWTCQPETLALRQSLDDEGFIHHLQNAFGDRAGSFTSPSPRKNYPLSRGHLQRPAGDRLVVAGNAAHTVHPVAGQGFNLGLRDVATLAELLFDTSRAGGDIGANSLLTDYNERRKRDTFMVRQFTHGLISLFSADLPPIPLLRSVGLAGVELLPPLKRFLLHRTMGMAGPQGRLARGLPLGGKSNAA